MNAVPIFGRVAKSSEFDRAGPDRRWIHAMAAVMLVAWPLRGRAESPPRVGHNDAEVLAGASRAGFNSDDFRSNVIDVVRRTDRRDRVAGFAVGYQLGDRWGVEAGLVDLGTFRDRWTATSSPRFKDIDHIFQYRARAAYAAGRWTVLSQGSLMLDLRAGLAINEARNEFGVDKSRHIEPPLAPCVPFGSACYPTFSPSSTFASPGTHSLTRASPMVGVSMGHLLAQRTTIRIRYDHWGTFGRIGSVGRVSVGSWAIALEQWF